MFKYLKSIIVLKDIWISHQLSHFILLDPKLMNSADIVG